SLSATVILLCLFAPKLYIVLFDPSKNIQSKFKASMTGKKLPPVSAAPTPAAAAASQSKENNHVNKVVVTTTTANTRQRRLTPSEYATEVTFCNSKAGSFSLSIHEEMTQTDSCNEQKALINGICTDMDRQETPPKDDEKTDLIAKPKQRLSVSYLQCSSSRRNSTSLLLSNENPWKKMSNVRYKLEKPDETKQDASNPRHVYEQHITFV
ncbi:unnamed protein product, partial [Adineta ricciae]